jgi:excisionase family DNA binding protein
MKKEFARLKELEAMFGISVRTWREYIKRKELKAYKVGRLYLIHQDDFLDFIELNEAYAWRKRGEYPYS